MPAMALPGRFTRRLGGGTPGTPCRFPVNFKPDVPAFFQLEKRLGIHTVLG
jgi:hypothetical protein